MKSAIEAKDKGIDVSRLNVPQYKKEVRDLVKLNLLICIEDLLYYHKDVFDDVVKKILKNRKKGERMTIGDVRNVTGLSRKYIIPILNIMEKMKMVSRDGNDRVVL